MFTDYKQSIIILYHNNRVMLEHSLSTLLKTIPKDLEIIIIANNSNKEEIELDFAYSNIKIMQINQDLLYSRAANLGVEAASGDIITLCDQDLFYEHGWYTNLYNILCSNKKIGAVSPKLLNPYTNRIIDFGIAYGEQTIGHPSRGFLSNFSLVKENYCVSSACGAVLMTYKQLYKEIGGMDITMPYICCDCDYGIQLKKRNLETWVVANSIVYHIGSSSHINTKISKYSYMRNDSKAMFFAKDYSYIPNDLNLWMKIMIDEYQKTHKIHSYYYLFNFSTVSDLQWFLTNIRLTFSIDFYDIYNIHVDLPTYDSALPLYNTMPLAMLNIHEPIIYFVDSFLSLFDNCYWWKMRDFRHDIVIDRNGNVVSAEVIALRTI